ncbi:5'-methylthioadenosine phosphorylase [Maritimibacter sp. UBA3975]|uniref:5'-methylthioadenosine phosphorylase n=1 Tax=Maritimibacter sp. UBA3975 TaxID=1946833 RepID=UPI000C0AC308|nr:5'-methylthioadenosine phosphorylase [Maritimibacter sp. UBA3975]MAM60744.1 5'-methylthioadenosine phosphorylase [Maritimibacter sp.]|tara:strand:+ start:4628 stop:4960 length:333 start_codon:yes stop_codon:yes gene_type:complete
MRRLVPAAFLSLCSALPAQADGFVMGAGRWDCARALEAANSGEGMAYEQLVGWLMGFWSHATFTRETGFVDIVEEVGGLKIFELTMTECQRAPGDTLLYVVSRSMIENTK